jgi:hypothetical protein
MPKVTGGRKNKGKARMVKGWPMGPKLESQKFGGLLHSKVTIEKYVLDSSKSQKEFECFHHKEMINV